MMGLLMVDLSEVVMLCPRALVLSFIYVSIFVHMILAYIKKEFGQDLPVHWHPLVQATQ